MKNVQEKHEKYICKFCDQDLTQSIIFFDKYYSVVKFHNLIHLKQDLDKLFNEKKITKEVLTLINKYGFF